MNVNRDDGERLSSGFAGAILIFFIGWHWHSPRPVVSISSSTSWQKPSMWKRKAA
jgi:hypothetical protein